MLPISRILMPVDYSQRCLGMIPHVSQFARQYNAEILLLHVVNPVYVIPETGISASAILSVPEWILTTQRKKMEEFAASELRDFRVRRLVYEGDPEAQIVTTAEAEDVQLVVMPTHGYGVFRRFLLGSVTSKVLHDLGCPMLTGAHLTEQGGSGNIAISNIVCAIDRDAQSRDTLEWASSLAADFQATLSVVHAIPRLDPSLGVSSDSKAQMEATVREEIGNPQSYGCGQENGRLHSGRRRCGRRVRLRQVCRSPPGGHWAREGSADGSAADQCVRNYPAISLPGGEHIAGDIYPTTDDDRFIVKSFRPCQFRGRGNALIHDAISSRDRADVDQD